MRTYNLSTILMSMFCLFLLSSCERSEIQSTSVPADSTKPITNRAILECDDCPMDYCCCEVQLLSDATVTLTFCGVYTGPPSLTCPIYTLPTGCTGTVSAFTSQILFSTSDPKELFCLPIGGTFRIFNPMEGAAATIRFTCQQGGNPDYESITLLNGGQAFYTSDGDCFLEECP